MNVTTFFTVIAFKFLILAAVALFNDYEVGCWSLVVLANIYFVGARLAAAIGRAGRQ